MNIPLLPWDARLAGRYTQLVQSHLHTTETLAAAGKPAGGASKAQTQAASRFYNNPRVELPFLASPLLAEAQAALRHSKPRVALAVTDWTKLSYKLDSKCDLTAVSHETDFGYELTCTLVLNGQTGAPIAPLEMTLRTSGGMLSTRPAVTGEVCNVEAACHVEQILPIMKASSQWALELPIVHIIDREADSIAHLRDWDQAGHLFLIRANSKRIVRWRDESLSLQEIALRLEEQNAFLETQSVEVESKPARRRIAEVDVVIDRPGKRTIDGKRVDVKGRPLALRLTVVSIEGQAGYWWLLSNTSPFQATTTELADWYYYRWRIETCFKLFKSAGLEIEQWQQESGPAIMRRLCVAVMACVHVWKLQQDKSEAATQLKEVLVRLSRRQQKPGREPSASTLLAGFLVLLPMLQLHADMAGDFTSLTTLVHRIIPDLKGG